MGEADPLHVGRQAHDDAVRFHRLRIQQDAAQQGGADDGPEHVGQHAGLVLHQHVEGRLDDHRVGAGDRGEEPRQHHGDDQLAPARVDPLAHEPLEQPPLPLGEGERAGGGLAWRGGRRGHDEALAFCSSGSRRRCMWTTK